MNYIDLEIGGETYKLRLTTRNTVALEKSLGRNPLDIILQIDKGVMPRLTDIVIIFHSMLQSYQHNITLDKAYDLFDAYVEGGNSMFDFVNNVMVVVFENSGLLNKQSKDNEDSKN